MSLIVLVLKGNVDQHDLTRALDVEWNLSDSFYVLSKIVVSFLHFAGIAPVFSSSVLQITDWGVLTKAYVKVVSRGFFF